MKFLQEYDFEDIIETITTSNIDKKLDYYATLLTILMRIKEKFEEEEEDSDAESLIDTDDIELCSDSSDEKLKSLLYYWMQ
jgi:hypothetical protein